MDMNFDDFLKDFGSKMGGNKTTPGTATTEDKLRMAEKALNHYKDRAKIAEDALLGLTCSGSEFFLRHGDGYRVDVQACVVYIRKIKENQHNTIKRVMIEVKRLQNIYG